MHVLFIFLFSQNSYFASPLGGTPPAGHLRRASLELLEVLGLDVKRPECLLEPLGVIFEALEPSWPALGVS